MLRLVGSYLDWRVPKIRRRARNRNAAALARIFGPRLPGADTGIAWNLDAVALHERERKDLLICPPGAGIGPAGLAAAIAKFPAQALTPTPFRFPWFTRHAEPFWDSKQRPQTHKG